MKIDDISQAIGMSGGVDQAWYKITGVEHYGEQAYFPAIKEGRRVQWSEFDGTLDQYMALKVRRTRMAVRLSVEGNPVAAENAIHDKLGFHALSCTPNTVDVYLEDRS